MHPASLALLELTSVRALAGTHGDAGDASVPRAPMNSRSLQSVYNLEVRVYQGQR